VKNKESWKPTKFVLGRSSWKASSDPKKIGRGSRLIGDIQAKTYSEAIQSYSHGRLLDLGCGAVPLYGMYRDRIKDNICVDWENSLHSSPHTDVFCDLNKTLPFSENEFETILLMDVIEHIERPEKLWNEMSRILKKRGKVILGSPFLYWIHEEPFDFSRFTEYKLRSFCKENRFEIISLFAYGGAPEVFLDFIAKHLEWSVVFSKFHYWFSKVFLRSPIGRSWSKKTKHKYPLGYCLVAEKQ